MIGCVERLTSPNNTPYHTSRRLQYCTLPFTTSSLIITKWARIRFLDSLWIPLQVLGGQRDDRLCLRLPPPQETHAITIEDDQEYDRVCSWEFMEIGGAERLNTLKTDPIIFQSRSILHVAFYNLKLDGNQLDSNTISGFLVDSAQSSWGLEK